MSNLLLEKARSGSKLSDSELLQFADFTDTGAIARVASELRDQGFNNVVTYSRKVFLPLTHLCRDVCHYLSLIHI